MKRVSVSVAALNQTPLAWGENRENILSSIEQAKKLGAKILCLPELCITGYGCEDAFYSPALHARAEEELVKLLRFTKDIFVTFGLPVSYQGALYNCVAAVCDGELCGIVAKKHLAGDGIYYEPRWFKPWPEGKSTSITFAGLEVPLGDLIFDIAGIRVGFEICEDAWVPERAGIELARQGCDIILNPSASHFAFKKRDVRRRFVTEGSRAFGVAYLYANLLGCESGRIIYDGDTLIAQNGEIVSSGKRFSYQSVVVSGATLDVDTIRLSRYRSSSFPVATGLAVHAECKIDFDILCKKTIAPTLQASWEHSEFLKQEEFTRSVSLGLFDYLRKSHHNGFVISLSGGVDSSATSCLVQIMIRLALAELGREAFNKKLSFLPDLKMQKELRSIARLLLTCVYQRTKNSSKITQTAASTLADSLGAHFIELSIDELVDGYTALIGKALSEKLSWATHDAALQNIQARVRSPSVWLIANLKKSLLLTTSNRSEASVGYTTMDGDTSGGLSPLGGIDKAFLRIWCRWLEKTGPDRLGPIPELKRVNEQEPTAELRPLSAKQTDEADLMPYEILDQIERLAIRDKMSPQEVLVMLKEVHSKTYPPSKLKEWVRKFYRLWAASQWKRERYAPSFHLDDESVDPKTWCRFPILSGGWADELEGLE